MILDGPFNHSNSILDGQRHPKAVVLMPYHPGGARNHFHTAIHNVFKHINKHHFGGKMSLSNRACRVLNDIIVDAFQKLLMEAQVLIKHENRRVMTTKSLDGAVMLLIRPPSFARRFQFYGRKSVCEFFHNPTTTPIDDEVDEATDDAMDEDEEEE